MKFICHNVKSHVPFFFHAHQEEHPADFQLPQAGEHYCHHLQGKNLRPSKEIASLRLCFQKMEGKKVLLLLPSPQPCPDGWCCSWVEQL